MDKTDLLDILKKSIRKNNLVVYNSGKSMLPLIKPNSRLTVKYSCDINTGDIILIDTTDHFVVHRVIKKIKGNSLFLTKGDSNLNFDKTVSSESIIGKVIKVNNIKLTTRKWSVLNYIISKFSYAAGLLPAFLRQFKYSLQFLF
ncbi:hypothetical protein GF327_00030 [Candidatus Woesearchaeota archaeon]|nr:hypothetical protein [Candidatus Woesearchaeota archaeon]